MERSPSFPRICPGFAEEDYAAFRAAIGEDHRLPSSYVEWRARDCDEERIFLAAAHCATRRIPVRFSQFQRYCDSLRMRPSFALLIAYCVTLFAKVSQAA